MATPKGPAETGHSGPEPRREAAFNDEELERRRRELEASRRPEPSEGKDGKTSSVAGFGQALKLSSEFIAGIVVGVGIGWFVDRLLGTSPWGLIVFLMLGFGAGVLNVLRSAGLVADFGRGSKPPAEGKD